MRATLYMASLVAIQHNPVIIAFYQRLLSAGKPKKVALMACAHQLLGILNALVTQGQSWRDPKDAETAQTTTPATRG